MAAGRGAEARQLLLAEGSEQSDLWDTDYFPGAGPEGCAGCTALINIRPAQNTSRHREFCTEL